jgi:hypothetical protein
MLPAHLFICDDGGLYDTRQPDWSAKPIRANYKRYSRNIENAGHLKAALRSGQYAWPGGYPMYFITSDGAALSFDSVRENLCSVLWAMKNKADDGWRVVACDTNYEDADLICDHSGKEIECAYKDT